MIQRVAWLPVCAALAMLPPLRGSLEGRMLAHMLLQLPMLVAAGWVLAAGARQRAVQPTAGATSEPVADANAHGIAGLLGATLALAFWMTPIALDHAVTSPAWDGAKALSLLLAGAALCVSWPRAGSVVQAFFVGNAAWMTAVVGLLYQQLPQRLCNAYLQDDQSATGLALVALAAGAGLFWTGRVALRLHREPVMRDPPPGDEVHGH